MTAPRLSFEMFPPKKDADADRFEAGLSRLAHFHPEFLSITYGANGGGRKRSEAWISRLLQRRLSAKIAAHITATGHSKTTIQGLLKHWRAEGVTRLVALRGDGLCKTADQAFPTATGLVEAASQVGFRDISVACYPEGHPLSVSSNQEMELLKRKLDAGARRAISQFFFEPELFLRYRDRCHRYGITQPIVPGLLVPATFPRIRGFAQKCGTKVPRWLDERFDGLEDDPTAASQIAVATTVTLAERLGREGCSHIHIYTLNRFSEAVAIARCLGSTAIPAVQRDLTKRKVA